jgi:two-component system chemotaxis response regulator CheB
MNKVILISGSSGSLAVLLKLLPEIKVSSNNSWVIVIHRKRYLDSKLERVFADNCTLKVSEVMHLDKMELNTVYLAPADYHLLINEKNEFELDFSEKIMFSRPSIDVSAITFAEKFKDKLIFVLLSGGNSDGAYGAKRVLEKGGEVIVQSPNEAKLAIMPNEALKLNPEIKYILPIEKINNTIKKINNTIKKTL